MTPVVVDTDVASFLFKNDTRASAYLRHLRNRQWPMSFMMEAELEQWSLLANWRPKRTDGWIAATAVLYDAPLITHNANDYLGVPGLRVITETP